MIAERKRVPAHWPRDAAVIAAGLAWIVLVVGAAAMSCPIAAGDAIPVARADDTERAADGGAVDALNDEGVRFYENRQYHQAIQRFARALDLAPENAEVRANLAAAWSGLGVEFLNSGESRSAREAFEKSLGYDEDFYAHFGLGYIGFLERDDDLARRHLGASIRLREDFGTAHKILAMVDYRQGHPAAALEGMQRAARLDPDDDEASAIAARWKREAAIVADFRERRSRRFLLRYDPALSADQIDGVLDRLEHARDAIGEHLGQPPEKRLVVSLFEEASFREATGSHHWIGGLFDGQIKIAVRLPKPGDSGEGDGELVRALRHELTHALVKDIDPACPNWLNEGLAQFFELAGGAGGDEGASRRAIARQRDVEARLRAGSDRRIPFARIPARLWEIANESEARWTYLEGLGFVCHLADRYGIFRLRLLLEAARQEGSLQRGFERVYGDSLETVENRWWRTLLDSAPAGR